jgi:uncharacterized membrane protein AbrB (regulator of aidB expression)
MTSFILRKQPPALQWAMLLIASIVCVAAFELMRLPAALMLGAIAAAILLSWFEGRVTIPPWAFVIPQGFVGCLVARAITPDIVMTIFRRWPMFLVLIGAVIFFAAVLGYALASSPRHDRGLGVLRWHRDGDGADVRSLWRRHEA